MAISFVSVRSQNEIMKSNKNNAKSKGETLTKLASGKNYNHPRDGISEFRNISTLKTSINQYNSLFKNISKYSSKMEIALETTNLLREKYEELKIKINDVDTDFKIGAINTLDQEYVRGKSTRQALQEEINVIINTIESTINNTDFLGEKTFQKTDRLADTVNLEKTVRFSMSPHDDFSITLKNIDFASSITAFSGGFDDVKNKFDGSTSELKKLIADDKYYQKFINDSIVISNDDMAKINAALEITDANVSGAADGTAIKELFLKDDYTAGALKDIQNDALKTKLKNVIYAVTNPTTITTDEQKKEHGQYIKKAIKEFLRDNSLSRSNLLSAITSTIDAVSNNYQAELSAITNIDNSENLLTIQKNNIQAALSSIEDTDVQEEMMNLMNEEILEQLSSEALVKIKESSKYIVRLIQS